MQPPDIPIANHPSIGHEIEGYGKHYIVKKAVKQYYHGWYTVLLIERNNSHDVIYWEDLGCTSMAILKNIIRCRNEFTLH